MRRILCDQSGQQPPGQIAGGDSLSSESADDSEARRRIEAHCRHPVPWHPYGTAPVVSELDSFKRWKPIHNGLVYASVGGFMHILLITDARAKLVGGASAAEKDPPVRGAGEVVHSKAIGSEAFMILPSNLSPLCRSERLREANQRVHGKQRTMKLAQARKISFSRKDDAPPGVHFAS